MALFGPGRKNPSAKKQGSSYRGARVQRLGIGASVAYARRRPSQKAAVAANHVMPERPVLRKLVAYKR